MTNSKSWNADEEDDEAWDILFPHHKEDVGDFLNPEGPDGDMPDIKSSAQLEVTTQKEETEDVETLETSEAPIENIPLPFAHRNACSRSSSCYRNYCDRARHYCRACLY